MALLRAMIAAALVACGAADEASPINSTIELKLTPWQAVSNEPNVRGLEEQLGASVHSLVHSKDDAEAAADAEAESESESKPELEMLTGATNARIIGKLPPGLPLASLQVVQHGRLVIVIYHLGGKHTTGVEHHFVLEFEPIKPGTAQYSASDGSFSYTVPRPQPADGGKMQHVPVSVEADKKAADGGKWVEAKTPDGKKYYYNTATRKTSWVKPANSALVALEGSEVISTASLRDSTATGLPQSLEMAEKSTGAEIAGVLPSGLEPKALQVLQHDRQVIVNYELGGASGNVGVEQRFVLPFEPGKVGSAKYLKNSGKFSLSIAKPEPLQGGKVVHIPIKLISAAKPQAPAAKPQAPVAVKKALLSQGGAELRGIARAA